MQEPNASNNPNYYLSRGLEHNPYKLDYNKEDDNNKEEDDDDKEELGVPPNIRRAGRYVSRELDNNNVNAESSLL